MRGRYCTAVFFAVIALLFTCVSGHAQNEANPPKSPTKHRRVTRSRGQAPQLNSDHKYVVRRGDCLIKIARAFETTPEALIAANGLRSEKVKIGQELKVPVAQSTAATMETPKTVDVPAAPSNPSMSAGVSQESDQDQDSDAASPALRLRLVEAGFEMIGVRYRRSGGSEKSGFDCSGLVKNLFSKFNIELPRSSREQFKQGEKVDRDKLEIGDLVFFSSGGNLPTHVGIYVGNDKFLHAALKARQVIVSDLNKFWYAMRYLGARRIMNLWWEESGTAPAGN